MTDLDSQPQMVALVGGLPTVVYVFRTDCRWCERNSASITKLGAALDGHHRLIGLSLSGTSATRDFVNRNGLTFPVYIKPTPNVLAELGISSTPETVVIDAKGVIQRKWAGAFIGAVKRDVEKYFEAALPEITSATAGAPE